MRLPIISGGISQIRSHTWKISDLKIFNFREFIVVIIERVAPIKVFLPEQKSLIFHHFLDVERFSRVFYSQNDVFRRVEVFYQHWVREAVSVAMSGAASLQTFYVES